MRQNDMANFEREDLLAEIANLRDSIAVIEQPSSNTRRSRHSWPS